MSPSRMPPVWGFLSLALLLQRGVLGMFHQGCDDLARLGQLATHGQTLLRQTQTLAEQVNAGNKALTLLHQVEKALHPFKIRGWHPFRPLQAFNGELAHDF